MKRKIINQLLHWKNSNEKRQPLILLGARQVGKTYILHEFGATYYEDVCYLNFEVNLAVAQEFESNISPERIIFVLEQYFQKKIFPEKTLIIFDEIQSCERAMTSLKYFSENAPQYHIVAAGSLLGVSIHREKYSFPVGQVSVLQMFPMDFEEFLEAIDETSLLEMIRTHYETKIPLPQIFHKKALDLYRNFLIIGGMPAVVKDYSEHRDLIRLVDVQKKILDAYTADMAKYAENTESIRIRACYDSIPAQLAKENKKFQYKVVQRGGSSALFGVALDWLTASGIILKCTRLSESLLPPVAYLDFPNFKIYMSDCGLLSLKSQIPQSLLLLDDAFSSSFKGAIVENYIAATLSNKGYNLWYWTSNNTAEIDFIILKDNALIPVEVKSSVHVKSRSLSVYAQKYHPPYIIRFSEKNFGEENQILSIPLYAAFCI